MSDQDSRRAVHGRRALVFCAGPLVIDALRKLHQLEIGNGADEVPRAQAASGAYLAAGDRVAAPVIAVVTPRARLLPRSK
jgi:hypothetical protein